MELEFPIKGITTTIGSEFEGVYQGLKYVQENFKNKDSRVVILSDCKFVVNSILNKCNSETYNFPVADCQSIMKELGENDCPEIYWIKGHSGIPGNERADQVAKKARLQAEIQQPEIYRRPDKTSSFLNFQGLNPYFIERWNRHWINEGNELRPHKHPKRYLRNLIECQSFEKIVLHNLEVHERLIVCRIITGKIGLNGFLHKINRTPSECCRWCEEEKETLSWT